MDVRFIAYNTNPNNNLVQGVGYPVQKQPTENTTHLKAMGREGIHPHLPRDGVHPSKANAPAAGAERTRSQANVCNERKACAQKHNSVLDVHDQLVGVRLEDGEGPAGTVHGSDARGETDGDLVGLRGKYTSKGTETNEHQQTPASLATGCLLHVIQGAVKIDQRSHASWVVSHLKKHHQVSGGLASTGTMTWEGEGQGPASLMVETHSC